MDLGLTGRVAVVTAGSRGLGRATALALAAEGCDLVLSSRGGDALVATAAEAAGLGVAVEVVEADVTDPTTPRRLVERAVQRFGRLDVAIGNAGGPPPGGPSRSMTRPFWGRSASTCSPRPVSSGQQPSR